MDLRSPPWHSFCLIGRLSFIAVGFLGSVALAQMGRPEMARLVYGLVIFFLNYLVNGFPLAVAFWINFPGTNQRWASMYPLVGGLILGLYWGGTCLWRQDRILQGRMSAFPLVTVSVAVIAIVDGQVLF